MLTDGIPRTPFKNPTEAASWIPALAILASGLSLSYLIGEDEGWAAGAAIAAIATVVQFSWPLRKEVWFWFAVGSFAAVHAWAVYSFDWSWISHSRRVNGTDGSGLKGLGLLFCADVAAMMAIIYALYCLKYGKPVEASEPSIDESPRYTDRDIDL